jgi:hypothetical protein
MQRSATVLKKLRNRLSSQSSPHPPALHLCESCQGLILTDEALKHFPKSSLPDGSPSIDLSQGFIDLPLKRRDRCPDFPSIRTTASQGCGFCIILLHGIDSDKAQYRDIWHSKVGETGHRDVSISFRYNCVAELGKQSFMPGEWPHMLSTLEVLISGRGRFLDPDPIIIIFKVFGKPGSSGLLPFCSMGATNGLTIFRFCCGSLFSNTLATFRLGLAIST